jgi:hypothetical protein
MAGPTVDTPRGPFTLARSCDGCTLCCRVMEATTLGKPMGVMCGHCTVGSGCGIHEVRPAECRNYHCGWLIDASLGEEWRPELAHIIITYDLDGRRLNANADPDYPDAWRCEPYHSQLRRWATDALSRNGHVMAHVGHHSFVILPDRDIDLGILGRDDFVFIERVGEGWDARRLSSDEAAAMSTGPRA